MSIEYSTIGEVLVDDQLLRSLAQRLALWKEYVVLEATSVQILLRFHGANPRSSWPADVAIQKQPAGIYMAIYSASREQRDTILQRLKEILKAHGIPTEFAEL